MRILSVTLNNFRQFPGENTIELSGADGKKVSLIYGTNGGGKTTLLSAIYWCLQGSAPYIKNPKKLANRHLFDALGENEELDISVTVKIQDNAGFFLIKRNRLLRKEMGDEVKVRTDKLEFTTDTGTPVGNPQFEVNRRFPERFAKFFFVPGESIDAFFKGNSLESLLENIKSISEIASYESAIDLASKVEKKILKDISDSASDAEITTQRGAIDSLKDRIYKKSDDEAGFLTRASDIRSRISELKEYLGETQGFEKLIQRVDLLTSQIEGFSTKLKQSEDSLDFLIKRNGHLAFTENLDSDLANAMEKLGIKNKPREIFTRELLVELASMDTCVCGEILTEEHKKSILDRINAAPVESSSSSNVNYKPLSFDLTYDNYKSRFRVELDNFNSLSRSIAEAKALLATELNSNDSDDQKMQKFKELRLLDLDLKNLNSDLATVKTDIEELQEHLVQAEKKLTKLIASGSIQDRMQANRQALLRVKEKLESDLNSYRDNFFNELNDELDSILGKIVSEPVTVQLKENFDFDLTYTSTGEAYSEAGGEIKAKAMAMIIALYRIAAKRAQSGAAIGTTVLQSFPLIIDSAFGELGTELRKRVAQELLQDTSQCILLLSDTQAPGVVDSIAAEDISTEILLHSFSTGSGADSTHPPIRGKQVTWLTMNAGFARTEIERLA